MKGTLTEMKLDYSDTKSKATVSALGTRDIRFRGTRTTMNISGMKVQDIEFGFWGIA